MSDADENALLLSHHAERRTTRRNILPAALEYVLTYGGRIQRTGVTFYLSQPAWPPTS